ncbi:hypothetical protein ABB37_05703 [Leptomonas pyrrhocoris]|uniref:Uncharacterized protein n=1 Tax=Leptomonas pyrrhocoris TaxID=157538 RepID=A0A0M9FZP0_LEPPY|nr:hypothetical protein ABB37_05703 [Leptomonas pyrrhocoris]KPA79219.1 hypothetical protein ABB37_05703 [Leptomonas pyrrhocoris]|eukprot:XP_015657658.1 hypothetical protein ABB37_05703 [Leptomonas pyrrhocoris]
MSSSSEEEGRPAAGVRKFKLDNSESSSSSSVDGDVDRANGATAKRHASASTANAGGGAATTRHRAGSLSSLDLSTSSSNSSSSSFGVLALPAAFRSAAAVSAAVQKQLRHGSRSSSSAAEDVDKPPQLTRSVGGEETAAATLAVTASEVASDGASRLRQIKEEEIPDKTAGTAITSTLNSGSAAAAALPAAPAVESDTTKSSPASASSPSFRAGADFFFKRHGTPPRRTSTPGTQESSAPAAVAQFAVPAGSDGGDSSTAASGKDSVAATTHPRPTRTSHSIAAVPAPVSSGAERREPPVTSPLTAIQAARDRPTPASGPSAVRKFPVMGDRPSHATAASIGTSSRTSTTAAAPPLSSPPPLKAPPVTAAAAAVSKRAAVAVPPALQIRKVATDLDSGAEESTGGHAPRATLAAGPTKDTEALPAAAKSSARASTSEASVFGAALATRPETSQEETANQSAIPNNNPGSPSLSGPSGNLAYNRVSARGIGSVPASVIAAPSRPRRRALPTEHTMSGEAAAEGSGPIPSTHRSTPSTNEPPTESGAPAEKEKANTDEVTLSPPLVSTAVTGQTAAPPHRPQRRAPRMPHTPSLPPPTLLEDEDGDAEAAKTTNPAPTNAASTRAATQVKGTAEEVQQAPARFSSSSSPPTQDASYPLSPPSSSPPTAYRASSAATAALQRQLEAALVIYDDRVPPEWRTGRHAQPFAGAGAAALSREPVATWMVLREPVRDVRARGTASHTPCHVPPDSKASARANTFGCRPVLHIANRRRASFSLLRTHEHRSHRGELGKDDAAEMLERAATGSSGARTPRSSTHGDRLTSSRTPSPRATQRVSSTSGRSHVSDAVVQQLLQQYGPHAPQRGNSKTDATADDSLDDVPDAMAAGRVSLMPARDLNTAKMRDATAKRPSSPSKRRKTGEVGDVDILNYRSTRSH